MRTHLKHLKNQYTNDYQSFVDYNIVDVELVDELEKKLKLIELCITMGSYNAKVNYEDIYSIELELNRLSNLQSS